MVGQGVLRECLLDPEVQSILTVDAVPLGYSMINCVSWYLRPRLLLFPYCDAKRILFLVDTRNLREQAGQEFMAYVPNDDKRKFTELYDVQLLASLHNVPIQDGTPKSQRGVPSCRGYYVY